MENLHQKNSNWFPFMGKNTLVWERIYTLSGNESAFLALFSFWRTQSGTF